MTPPPAGSHPEHALEQAYIERVNRAAEDARARDARAPEAAADPFAARNAREQMLARLKEPIDLDALCFGRIDLDGGRSLYLGREAVHENLSHLLVINWRKEAAAPFYTASKQDPQGLTRRRRFQLDDLRLLGIVDDVFDRAAPVEAAVTPPAVEPAVEPPPVEEPRDATEAGRVESAPVEPTVIDAILADMDRARSAEMHDIVATIEARQYELISDSIDGLLVIQGGPGSGKTAIALHRAAWLLFNHRDELERSGVLIVGPNRAFMEYVAQVLPSLGESKVVQTAVDLLPAIEDARVRGSESEDLARLKGEIRMAAVIQHAVQARVRRPKQDVSFMVDRTRVSLPSARLSELIDASWKSGATYLPARESFRRELVALAQARAGSSRTLFRSGPSASEIEMGITRAGGPLESIWPTTTAPEVLRDLFNSRRRLAASGGPSLSEGERDLLHRDRCQFLRDEPWTAADIPLLDEADRALRGVTSAFGYVLADEAQDLSPMQLRMILQRSGSGRATLVGDIAQATGPTRFEDWEDLLDATAADGDSRIAELAISYRVPRQIMDLAEPLLQRIAPKIVEPTAVRIGPEEPRLLARDEGTFSAALLHEVRDRAESERTVGVIAPAAQLEAVRASLTESGIQAGDVLADGLARQVTVLSAEQAKGLEFDHVIVVEPVAIAGPDGDWAYVYIALTRATRTLSVIYSTPEPFELPAPDAPPDLPAPLGSETTLAPPEAAPKPGPAVAAERPGTVLGGRYTEALMQAKFLHANQHRRGTFVPYLAHLQAVAALVLEDGGSEDEAIAALLHDSVEDYGQEILDQIADRYGLAVARIVAGCTDPDEDADASWHDRKINHLRALESAGPLVRRVALAEKLDNARALLRDYRRLGERLWERMEVDRDELLWYTAALADLFVTERPGDMAFEFSDTVERLLDLVTRSGPTA